MKGLKYLSIVFLSSICLLTSCSSEAPHDGTNGHSNWELTDQIDLTAQELEIAEGINEFSYMLSSKASEISDSGEFCVSPISISIYLGMLANASDGVCREQILSALGTENIDELNSLSKKLMQYLPCDENGSSISVNNRIWVARHNKVPKDFVSTIGKYFNAGVDLVDFHKESTIKMINEWVCDNTQGKIPGILFENWEHYRDNEMVSANTVYFKGDWASVFDKNKTVRGIFHAPMGDLEAEMMCQKMNTAYFENDIFQYVSLSFDGYRNAMELYLPSKETDIRQFLRGLSASVIDGIKESQEICNVTLRMPSFNNYYETNISGILKETGITSLDNVDLSPMGLRSMPIVPIHTTSIKIDEKGAELAAVTANVGEIATVPEEYKKVRVDFDRPFFYVIRNRKTNAILLAGTVTNP